MRCRQAVPRTVNANRNVKPARTVQRRTEQRSVTARQTPVQYAVSLYKRNRNSALSGTNHRRRATKPAKRRYSAPV